MKKITFLILIVSYSLLSYGQCDQILGFTSQAQIDNFASNYPGCTTIAGLAIVGGNITNLNGLSQLTSITGLLTITSSTNQPTDGIIDYPLTDISGLNNLTLVGGKIRLYDLPNLSTSSILRNLISSSAIEISGLTPAVISGFYNLLTTGEITISSPTLIELSAFTFLSTSKEIYISNNSLIRSIGGFVNLELINGSLTLTGNPNLITLPNMPNLAEITGVFNVTGNDLLADLQGVERLTKVGSFIISNNDGLKSFYGMGNLFYLKDELSISNNPVLNNLNDLFNLGTINSDDDSINRIGIDNNTSLSSLTGLANISPTSIGFVGISGNPNLSICSITNFCKKIALDGGAQNFSVANNLTGCNSGQEIYNACQVLSVTENNLEISIEVYPNPVTNKLYLKNVLNESAFTIVDLKGKTHLNSRVINQRIDVSQLANGIYLLIVNTEKGVVKTKFIKE